MKYDSPVAMPTIFVDSYKEGYQAGYYGGALAHDNPYEESRYHHARWELGRWDGRFAWRNGKAADYSSENEEGQ